MPGRPDESMTRTKSLYEGSGGPRGILTARRFAFLVFLVVLIGIVALSLGWATLSPNGSGPREVQAQISSNSSGASSEAPEIAQSQPSQSNDLGSDEGARESGQENYAAFGDRENPFEPVIALSSVGDNDGSDGSNGEDGSNSGNNGVNGGGSGGVGSNDGGGSFGGSGNGDRDGGSFGDDTGNGGDEFDDLGRAPGNSGNGSAGNNTITGPNGERIDCSSDNNQFERVICEDELQGEDSDYGSDTLDGRQPARAGDPGSGGSGRSGIGESAHEFRNGGSGGVGK